MRKSPQSIAPEIVRKSRRGRLLGFRILLALISTVFVMGILGSAESSGPAYNLVMLTLIWTIAIAVLAVAAKRVQFHVFRNSIFLSRLRIAALIWGGDVAERTAADFNRLVIGSTGDSALVTAYTLQGDKFGFYPSSSVGQVAAFVEFLKQNTSSLHTLIVEGELDRVPELGFLRDQVERSRK